MSVRPRRPERPEWVAEWVAEVERDHEEDGGLPGPPRAPTPQQLDDLQAGRSITVQGVRLPRAVLVDAGLHPDHLWRFVRVTPAGSVTPVRGRP